MDTYKASICERYNPTRKEIVMIGKFATTKQMKISIPLVFLLSIFTTPFLHTV